MTRSEFLETIAGSSAALVQDYDLTGMLVRTVGEAAETVGADSAGLLVRGPGEVLELLTATSHTAVALETYQAISGEGPCQECMDRVAPVRATRSEVEERWPELAALMEVAGYVQVVATPLRWHGTALGGLNLFWSRPLHDGETVEAEAQTFADILTLFIANSEPISSAEAEHRLAGALEDRAVIEQAKGVLAQQEGVEMSDAYVRLRHLALESDRPLTEVARALILAARTTRPSG